ncbi:MAG: tRNA (N6-threonylcarbamoyladenosine(37)-N6)-methyltransferase TrmO [Anaerolineaceae bacterium]|nr:tRNA (N6-threonylcarbamoyladenosine(37)-N6)-methyltransferase TrmO [Anaerolineaceae bacterium]
MTPFTFTPIGVIHSPFQEKTETPIQAIRSNARGSVEVFPEYTAGLEGIEEFSHLILLYVFHRSEEYKLMVQPFLDDQKRGLFTTRYPCRPNPLGFSVVGLTARRGHTLEIAGVDVLDGTPLLDIKPYIPDFDHRTGVCCGWYDRRAFP